ncbi:MAG: hypothetical protein KME30_01090 [Iphinoe sp. HA4291-MV1]|jgi:hypothetical protein|nr:hypothetical protein [Iphinoe sp. HA4291-MV1]
MFTIDLTVKNTAFPISIERKTAEDAEEVYLLIVKAMQTGNPNIVELKSEGKIEKKVAVRTSEISGVQLTQKEGSAAGSGRPPGFFAVAAE